jgi:hypothetical protein
MTTPTPAGASPVHGPGTPPEAARPVRWLLAAGLVAIVGLLAATAWAAVIVTAALGEPADFTRVAIPGAATLELRRGDTLVVYYEGSCTGTSSPTPALADLRLRVTAPGGSAVAVRPYAGSQRYDHAGGTGTAVATFRADAAGTYRITTAGPAGGALAVGPSVIRTAVTGLLGPALVAIAVVVLAVVIAAAPFTRPRRTT